MHAHVTLLSLLSGLALLACGPAEPTVNGNDATIPPWLQDSGVHPGGDGQVGSDASVDPGCAAKSKFVYVIDDANQIYRFDPSIADVSAFQSVGTLSCGSGQPNSMSVGRDGFAYVLLGDYDLLGSWSCTGIFKVSLDDAACLGQTPFQCGASGFSKFGMGFATLTAGSTEDRLYIGNTEGGSELGNLDVSTGAVQVVGNLPNRGGEFTGNANGELWGFFPYETPPAIIQIDKTTAQALYRVDLDSLPSMGAATSAAWAFAFWGGSFFVFYEVEPPDTSTNVYRLDPEGVFSLYIPNTGLRIVGAGVSTCAPVVVQ